MEPEPILQAASVDSDSDSEDRIPSLLEVETGTEQFEHPVILPIERDALPGRPVCAVPVVSVQGLATGDHVILETSEQPYRSCYQSGLVVEINVQGGRVLLIRNKKEGVGKEWVLFQSFHKVYIVQYTLCRYSEGEAIGRAVQRVAWQESLYHPLLNNSHHLVTWAKTGRENPLSNVLKDLEYTGNAHCLDPTLTKVSVLSLEDLKPGDHIIIKSEHLLLKHVDLERSSYTAITWSRGRISLKDAKWEENGQMFRIDYDNHANVFPAEKAIRDAESELKTTFKSSDEFVMAMKIGKRYTLHNSCLFSADNGPVSYTPVTVDIAIDEGDHLIIKGTEGKFHSVLLYKYIGEGVVVTMPDICATALYGELDLTVFLEVYRINYQESLPISVVLKRACSQTGEEVLRSCGLGEADKFISWAKTGQKSSADIARLQQETKPQVARLRPWERQRITSVHEIEVGDHLIQPFRGRWFHFMVTECSGDPSNPCNTKVIYCFRGVIGEKVIRIEPRNDEVHRICYPECLPASIAIDRARSKVGSRKLSPIARMWFVRWAKTGSDEGIEVAFLANNAVPVTKSRIVSFAQLNVGDYVVEKKQKVLRWHHYLITEVNSPTHCRAIESWGGLSPDKIAESELILGQDSTFYRLNYNDGACSSSDHAIATAREMIGKSVPPLSKYTRQKFVNFVKAGEASTVSVDELLDDRLFLPRERVESLEDVKPGDHLECLERPGSKSSFQHMMATEVVDKIRCKVLLYQAASTMVGRSKKGDVQELEVDLLNEPSKVFRVCYPERIPPQESIQLLRTSMEDGCSSQELQPVGELCVIVAILGDPTTIRVEDKLHHVLQYRKDEILKPITIALRCTTTESASRLLSLSKISAKDTKKETAIKLAARAGFRLAFRVGTRAALNSTAVGLLGGTGVGAFVLVEGPILARGLYKLHRKKKFDQISETDYTRGVIQETFKSVNVVVGAAGGAIVGQILIPIPGLGAGIGGAVGTVAGQIAGTLEGQAFSRLVREKALSLPIVVKYEFTDVSL